MGDLYMYAAMVGIAVFALMIPTLVFFLVRAWYSGVIEHRDAKADKLVDALVETMRGECATATVERAEHAVSEHRQARAGGRPEQQKGRHAAR